MSYLFDMRPERPGYRLHRLEMFNWGTFDSTDGTVFKFEPAGRTSLLVGKNGAGKSTLIDAVLTLLVEPRTRNYNVAAGAGKRERNEKSYIRGAFARSSDDAQNAVIKYLRPKAGQLTALAATFTDEQLGKSFTLCQVMHLASDGSADKLYGVCDEDRSLQEDLSGVRHADDLANHLRQLGYDTTKKFVQYRGWLGRRTGMLPKAMDMFNQTVAVKDIQSLDDFIRQHMLEPHDWRKNVSGLLTHFRDLNLAHQELVRTRRAAELLEPLRTEGEKYRQQSRQLADCEARLAAAEAYFRQQTVALFEPEIATRQSELAGLVETIDRVTSDQQAIAETLRQLKNEIDQAGGDRLRAIPGLLEIERGKLALKKVAFEQHRALLKRCGIERVVTNAAELETLRQELSDLEANAEERLEQAISQHELLAAGRGELRRALRSEQQELELLSGRRTNLPPQFSSLREQLCEDLAIAETDLPFVAELVAVDAAERKWEASAEMVLRPIALSLLVPDRLYQRVRSYIDSTQLAGDRGQGLKLDYLRVRTAAAENNGTHNNGHATAGDRLHAQSLLRKLKFQDAHSLTPWVREEVARRFDYRCCESVSEFNQTTRLAMTANRHVKTGGERHSKDDRKRTIDPRYFVLGWDNREKRKRIAAEVQALTQQVAETERQLAEQNSLIEELRTVRQAAGELLKTSDFDTIDVSRHTSEIAELQREQGDLEQSNTAVKALKKRLAQVEGEAEELQAKRDDCHAQMALVQREIGEGRRLVAAANKYLASAKTEAEYDQREAMFASIGESIAQSLDAPLTAANLFECESAWTASMHQQAQRLRGPLQSRGERVVEQMNRFLREFAEKQSDLSASLASLDSFLGLLDQIQGEDLPRHEQKFKDRLNAKVAQEIGFFHSSLREEGRQIEHKLSQLNQALGQLEYKPGTRMRLEPRRVQDREIEDFRRSLRECMDDSFDGSDEANEARFARIEKVVARLGDTERTRWRDKVVDVRNWYSFAAHEIDNETGETCSFHEGGGGQSGGEKAKLAFTILVAAIAYQYDIDPTGMTPGRFHFVVVDEMFSKIDDQNAEYALRLFEQFGLQLLIVAPLDAKARVTEPFVDNYLQVVKDEATGRSKLFSMTAREYEEVVQGTSGAAVEEIGGRRRTAK